jgi:acylphosphatase
MKTYRIFIDGTVQGVFFRSFVKGKAEGLQLKGFVRNLEDGRVEVFLEGNSEDVEKVVELCKKGPKNAQIKGIDMRPERFQDFKTFKILHI